MENSVEKQLYENIINEREKMLEKYFFLSQKIKEKSDENVLIIINQIINYFINASKFNIFDSYLCYNLSHFYNIKEWFKDENNTSSLFSRLSKYIDLDDMNFEDLSSEEVIKSFSWFDDLFIFNYNNEEFIFYLSDLKTKLILSRIEVNTSKLDNGVLLFDIKVPSYRDIAKRKLTMNK